MKRLLFVMIFSGMLLSCSENSTRSEDDAAPSNEYTEFELVPEWLAPGEQQDSIDVNLGHAPEQFVKAAYWQVFGGEPDAGLVTLWARRLKNDAHVRRIDVVRTFLQMAGRDVNALKYSDPWQAQIELKLEDGAQKITDRDIGAVFMFFFNTPGGVNGEMNWANTHAPGMAKPSSILGFGGNKTGYYNPKTNPGFWYRELMDAKYAGLDFLLLNTYGPDLQDGSFETLNQTLPQLDDPVKLALFDDTWSWGKPYFGSFWENAPDLSQTEAAAQKIYTAKWKPFYEKVPRKHWYLFQQRPFIYFYNGGTLKPTSEAAPVITRLKELFEADFGVEPFVAVDRAFFADSRMPETADAKFIWFTLDSPGHKSSETLHGVTLEHAMVKWDEMGRSHPGDIADASDRIIKDAEILQQVLNSSQDADVLVLATWNDLGEGTGMNRNYDYYIDGEWKKPNYFMQFIRAAQFDF